MCISVSTTDAGGSGAGSSQGRSSWTGKPELRDYTSFIGLFFYYLSGLRLSSSLGHHAAPPPLPSAHAPPSPITAAPPLGISLILGGYSYGSLLTSHLPAIPVLLDRFAHAADGTPESRIKSQALDLAAQWNQCTAHHQPDVPRARSLGVPEPTAPSLPTGFMSMGGEASGSESHRTSVESRTSFDFVRQSVERSRRRLGLRKSHSGAHSPPSAAGKSAAASRNHPVTLSQVCYLLISPLLPPVSHFVTMFSKFDSHHDSHHPPVTAPHTLNHTPSHDGLSPPERMLVSHPTLAIYGTQDFFCSHRKLQKWAGNLEKQPDSLFQYREISGAGHLWQESGAEKELRCRIREWLHEVVGFQEDITPSAAAADVHAPPNAN